MMIFFAHARSPRELLGVLKIFFGVCRKHNFKLNALKCDLFSREVIWCGRKITPHGITYEPRGVDGLLDMPRPRTASELTQFTHAANWMRGAIPDFSHLIASLNELLQECASFCNSTKKTKLKSVSLETRWGNVHQTAFDVLKKAISKRVLCGHLDTDKILYLFSDASDLHWAGVLTQVSREEIDTPVEEQNHQPLGFVLGSFKGALRDWSTFEKEGFAILQSMERLQHLTLTGEVRIHTDHANLVFIFNPSSLNPHLGKQQLAKIHRWAIKLSVYDYSCVHFPGERNVWADLMTRSGAPSGKIRRLLTAPLKSEHLDESLNDLLQDVKATKELLSPKRRQDLGLINV